MDAEGTSAGALSKLASLSLVRGRRAKYEKVENDLKWKAEKTLGWVYGGHNLVRN